MRRSRMRGAIDLPEFRTRGSIEQTAIRGKREQVQLTGAGGGNFNIAPTTLVRANIGTPRQVLVTIVAPTIPSGALPYSSTFDGLPYPPVGGAIFNAPVLPDVAAALQVKVVWGAGGARFETLFDYPALGGTFSITCDTLDVSVQAKSAQAMTYTAANAPVVGAFYVDGAPVDDTPMAWLELGQAVAAAAAPAWPVRPFAKELLLWVEPLVTAFTVEWLNTAGTVLAQIKRTTTAGNTFMDSLQVPRQATVVRFTNTGAVAGSVWMEWGIGLS